MGLIARQDSLGRGIPGRRTDSERCEPDAEQLGHVQNEVTRHEACGRT